MFLNTPRNFYYFCKYFRAKPMLKKHTKPFLFHVLTLFWLIFLHHSSSHTHISGHHSLGNLYTPFRQCLSVLLSLGNLALQPLFAAISGDYLKVFSASILTNIPCSFLVNKRSLSLCKVKRDKLVTLLKYFIFVVVIVRTIHLYTYI